MKFGCPNSKCKFYKKKEHISSNGTYQRKGDSRLIKRYKCNCCGKRFSSATFKPEYRQKKRRVNHLLFKLLASGVSMRRAAKLLNIHRTTVKRKLIYLAKKSRMKQAEFLQSLRSNPVKHVQFDDLITIEHTKMKPLSVTIAVDVDSRKILGAKVSRIPAFGHLAERSRKKYGRRLSTHNETLMKLLSSLQGSVRKNALIESDEHKLYPPAVKKFFPHANHKRYKGGRGCIVGQGELKKLYFDPLFALNHTCAMFRANINRLVRKTWCTTKDPAMLKRHIELYINYHNNILVA